MLNTLKGAEFQSLFLFEFEGQLYFQNPFECNALSLFEYSYKNYKKNLSV